MTGRSHHYTANVRWTGNTGKGTADYRAYTRDHTIDIAGKPSIAGSSDSAFRGARDRHNPEDLLVASLSACHMLWYLHLCAEAGIVVLAYEDSAEGVMIESSDGGGRFESVSLKPRVVVSRASSLSLAASLHQTAHDKCFIANSVNFPVACQPAITPEA